MTRKTGGRIFATAQVQSHHYVPVLVYVVASFPGKGIVSFSVPYMVCVVTLTVSQCTLVLYLYTPYCGLFCCLSLMAQQPLCGLYKRDRQTQTTIMAHLADG